MDKEHPIFSTAILGAVYIIFTSGFCLTISGCPYTYGSEDNFVRLYIFIANRLEFLFKANSNASAIGKLVASGFAFNILGIFLQQLSIVFFQCCHSKTGPKKMIQEAINLSMTPRKAVNLDYFNCTCSGKSLNNFIRGANPEALWTWLHWSSAPENLLEAGRRRRKWRYLGENWLVALVCALITTCFILFLIYLTNAWSSLPNNAVGYHNHCFDQLRVFISWATLLFSLVIILVSWRIMKYNKRMEEGLVAAFISDKLFDDFGKKFRTEKATSNSSIT